MDEVQFLLSALWDKIKIIREPFALSAISEGMLGITLLKDPIAENIRQFLYLETLRMGKTRMEAGETCDALDQVDVITAVRALRLNGLLIPKWLVKTYAEYQINHSNKPVVTQSRADKLIVQRYKTNFPDEKLIGNSLIDGFRMDMDFPDLKLNVELDGPSHRYPARARYDRSRDEYLRETQGYEIFRVQLVGKSIDEVTAAITKKVDELAATKTQQLYSK